MKFVDIHSHLIFDIDDGSKNIEESIKYLKQAKKIGLNKVVCTPHIKNGDKTRTLKIIENFKQLRSIASKLDITLYLGNEIMMSDNTLNYLENKKIIGINRTKNVLIEYKRDENKNIDYIISQLEELIENGYQVILAHPELYINYRNIETIKKIKESGILLQMDATSILKNKTNRKTYKFSKKLLKERLIDIVASDTHCTKKRDYLALKKAYKKVSKKYGPRYANIIFYDNPLEMINGV